jgi:hypothetical protein
LANLGGIMDSTDEVLRHIRNSLKVSCLHVHRFRRINTIIIVVTIISSIAATFFSGTAAVTVANASTTSATASTAVAANAGQRDWHNNKAAAVLGMDYATVCAIAAGLSFFSAIFTGLQVAFGLPAKLENASACMGKLMALEFSASMKRQNSDDIEDEYRKVITNYPEFITIKT